MPFFKKIACLSYGHSALILIDATETIRFNALSSSSYNFFIVLQLISHLMVELDLSAENGIHVEDEYCIFVHLTAHSMSPSPLLGLASNRHFCVLFNWMRFLLVACGPTLADQFSSFDKLRSVS